MMHLDNIDTSSVVKHIQWVLNTRTFFSQRNWMMERRLQDFFGFTPSIIYVKLCQTHWCSELLGWFWFWKEYEDDPTIASRPVRWMHPKADENHCHYVAHQSYSVGQVVRCGDIQACENLTSKLRGLLDIYVCHSSPVAGSGADPDSPKTSFCQHASHLLNMFCHFDCHFFGLVLLLSFVIFWYFLLLLFFCISQIRNNVLSICLHVPNQRMTIKWQRNENKCQCKSKWQTWMKKNDNKVTK